MSTNKSYHELGINTPEPESAEVLKATRRNSILLIILILIALIIAITGIVYVSTHKDRPHHVPHPHDPFAPSDGSNVADVKRNVIAYYESSKFSEHVFSLVSQWSQHFESVKASNGADALPNAVVFDIDETLLNNYPETKRADFAYDAAGWNKWVLEAKAPVIPGTQSFYNELRTRGIKVIMITGRHEAEREATEKNLATFELTHDELILRSPEEDKLTAAVYKAQRRQALSEKYNIVGCIGDQVSDCVGGYTGYIMKLPNYMYFIE
jgi:phosphoglycolate phosphatase-like HAD superfamily hydrolase